MNRFTASTLSAETARMDRLAGERHSRRDEPPAADAGTGSFAGLLRAAARGGEPGMPRMNAPPKNQPLMPTGAAPARPPGAPAESKSAEVWSRAERPRESSENADSTWRPDEASDDEDRSDESAATPPAASGGATLSHWIMQLAAQRHGRLGASASGTQNEKAVCGAKADEVGLKLPSWARPEGDDAGAAAGVWAGGARAAGVQMASPIETGSVERAVDARAQGEGGVTADPAPGFAGQLAALVGGAPSTGAASTVTVAATHALVQTPVGAPGFGDEVMMKVAACTRDGVQEAQLHLNPAELGPIQVRIALDGTQARIDFGATSESTRALLEQALPALAEALQADGLQLAAGSVVSEVSESQAAADFSGLGSGRGEAGPGAGQADAGGGGAGGWGQQSEASAAQAARNAPGSDAAIPPARGVDGTWGWPGQRASNAVAGLRGLDLYA